MATQIPDLPAELAKVVAGLGFLLAGVLDETWLVFAEGVAAVLFKLLE